MKRMERAHRAFFMWMDGRCRHWYLQSMTRFLNISSGGMAGEHGVNLSTMSIVPYTFRSLTCPHPLTTVFAGKASRLIVLFCITMLLSMFRIYPQNNQVSTNVDEVSYAGDITGERRGIFVYSFACLHVFLLFILVVLSVNGQ